MTKLLFLEGLWVWGKKCIQVQVTERVVGNNQVLTCGNEYKPRKEGSRSAANIHKVIGLRQVSCGNSRTFIALFYFSCYFPAAQSNRQEHDYWSWMTNSCSAAPADTPPPHPPKQMNQMNCSLVFYPCAEPSPFQVGFL